ncbi:MAG: prolyl oligopeptidase family serine peptidase [Bacteroidales bacterium]|nr:prolyl oligopeptidase family serine peptidase [Bacteroidales bacterium]
MNKLLKISFLIIAMMFCIAAQGQHYYVVNSRGVMPNDTVMAFVPKDYSVECGRQFPAVILLNGFGGNYRQWSRVADLQLYADEYGMILICPDGFADSWYIDSPIDSTARYATFFREEILPSMFKHFNIDSCNLFITGLSMGGHGALTLFMQNSDRFRAAGSMSGVMHLRSSSVSGSIAKLIGPKTQANTNWETYSVLYNTEKLAASGKPIIVNCGSEDYLVKVNRQLAAKCKEQNINIVYSESPGKHERDYWKRTLPGQLMYFRQFVNKPLYNED